MDVSFLHRGEKIHVTTFNFQNLGHTYQTLSRLSQLLLLPLQEQPSTTLIHYFTEGTDISEMKKTYLLFLSSLCHVFLYEAVWKLVARISAP